MKKTKIVNPNDIAPKGTHVVVPPKKESEIPKKEKKIKEPTQDMNVAAQEFLANWKTLIPSGVQLLYQTSLFALPEQNEKEKGKSSSKKDTFSSEIPPFRFELQNFEEGLINLSKSHGESLKQFGAEHFEKLVTYDPPLESVNSNISKAPADLGLICDNQGCPKVAVKEKPFAKCGKCGKVAYCGRECQIADWKARHKNDCKPPEPAITLKDFEKKLRSATDMMHLLLGDIWIVGGAWKKQHGDGILVMECGDLIHWHKLNCEEFCQFFLHYIPKSQCAPEAISFAVEGTVLSRHHAHLQPVFEKLASLSSNQLLFCVTDKVSIYAWKIPLPDESILSSLEKESLIVQRSPVFVFDSFNGMKGLLLPSSNNVNDST